MDRIKIKERTALVVALLIALVTLVAPASAADTTYNGTVNASYHAQLPGVTPAAEAGFYNGTWPAGSSMYDKRCGLPNMVMTFGDNKNYSEKLTEFNSDTSLNLTMLESANASWGNDIYTADTAEWMAKCGSCHIGGGGLNDQTAADIDCTSCHIGNANPEPTGETGAGLYIGDTSCFIKCHQVTTGDNAGTIEGTLSKSSKDLGKRDMWFQPGHDIHAGNVAFEALAKTAGYGNNTCLLCHTPGSAEGAPTALDDNTHNFGRGWTTDTAMDFSTMGTVKACDDADCHGANGGPHTNAILNTHTDKLTCFVCHTDKAIAKADGFGRGALSAADWTKLTLDGKPLSKGGTPPNATLAKLKFSASKGGSNFDYFWLGEKGGEGPNVSEVTNGVDFFVYPFISDADMFKDDTNAKIALANSIKLTILHYNNSTSILNIDSNILWAADNVSDSPDSTVTAEELKAIGYNNTGGYSIGKVVEYPKFSAHNINLGPADAYTCVDCHASSGGILDFEDLGYVDEQLGRLNGTADDENAIAIHEFVVTDVNNESFTLNDCVKCHGDHVPNIEGNRTKINTTTVTAITTGTDFDTVKLTDINGVVTNLNEGFVPTRYDIDFGKNTSSNVSLMIRDVYLDNESVISATVNQSIEMPKVPLAPDMIRLTGTLCDVSVDSTLDDGVRYTVTIPYGDESLGEYGAQTLRMYHYNEVSEQWEDCTTSINVQDKTVTGTTTSLSPFVVAVWPDATTATAFSGLGMISLMGLFIMFVAVISRRRDE